MIINNMTCPFCGYGVSFDDFESGEYMLLKLLFLKRYCHKSCYERKEEEVRRRNDYF